MRPSDCAWVTITAGVVVYEVIAAARSDWELLSEAVDRYRDSRLVATDLAVIYVAGHLLRVWPRKLDPLTVLAGVARRCAST